MFIGLLQKAHILAKNRVNSGQRDLYRSAAGAVLRLDLDADEKYLKKRQSLRLVTASGLAQGDVFGPFYLFLATFTRFVSLNNAARLQKSFGLLGNGL